MMITTLSNERCRQCAVLVPVGAGERFTQDRYIAPDPDDVYDTGEWVITNVVLCGSKECREYYDAALAVLEHYQVCICQDELRDPDCHTCPGLHERQSKARWAMEAMKAKRDGE